MIQFILFFTLIQVMLPNISKNKLKIYVLGFVFVFGSCVCGGVCVCVCMCALLCFDLLCFVLCFCFVLFCSVFVSLVSGLILTSQSMLIVKLNMSWPAQNGTLFVSSIHRLFAWSFKCKISKYIAVTATLQLKWWYNSLSSRQTDRVTVREIYLYNLLSQVRTVCCHEWWKNTKTVIKQSVHYMLCNI